MATSLILHFDGTHLAGPEMVNKYYEFMAERERESGAAEEYLRYQNKPEVTPELLSDGYEGKTISEQWFREVDYHTDIKVNDLFYSDEPDLIYGESLQALVDRLRAGKEQAKDQREDNEGWWKQYFELRLITLCEFALKNDYGVIYSN
jgi:hypothetical protein